MPLLFEPENLLPKDGIAIYHGVVFNEKEANQMCKELLDTIPWKQDEVVMFGKKIMTKRKVAWYADAGITYTYAGVKKLGLQWTNTLLEIKQKVEAITGATYNACLLNLYHEGEEGMGWHRDNEKEIIPESSIASLSFGAVRKFAFKHATTNERLDIELENGSLLDMKGAIQGHWYHALPKTTRIKQLRINLTFRLMHA
ncbi:MAG: alpha-ketoglutarate-dependent dioxygenase AlkB family protein [Sediminibacterium sp.]